jgi:hypothetical protein
MKLNAKSRFWLFLLVPIACVLAALGVIRFNKQGATHLRVMEMVFPSSQPKSPIQPVAVGWQRSPLGDGIYILAYKSSIEEFVGVAVSNDFNKASIDDNPTRWNLDLCNSLLYHIAHANFVITPDFECYSRDLDNKYARFFFDTNANLAVVIARGKYP